MRFPLLLAVLGLSLPYATYSCSLGDFNLTSISYWTWIERANISGVPTFFHINLCKSLGDLDFESKEVCGKSAVCHRQKNNEYKNIGNFTSITTKPDENGGGFSVDMEGDYCPSANTTLNKNPNYGTKINFRCGKTLGAPVFIEFSGCTYYFDWYSTVACKDIKAPAIIEVPCYVYDGKDNKIDLSPLIKQKGGYYVSSDTDSNIYINVCRDIMPEGVTDDCPSGSSACKKSTKGDSTVSMGSPESPLDLTMNGVSITYWNRDGNLEGCQGNPYSVTINFVCPKQVDSSRGSQDPVLTSELGCQLQVEWWTEHACPVRDHTSNDCTLKIPDQDIDINLNPLAQDDGSTSTYLTKSKEHTYFLNVCGYDAVENCDDTPLPRSNSVCQAKNEKDGSLGTKAIAGTYENQELRYGDGVLTLTYKGGDICHHNGFQRTSIITFQCDQSASNNGVGSPTFTTEEECTYFFNWPTKYACVGMPELICGVSSANSHFDLSVLTRSETDNSWTALDGRHDHKEGDSNYYINVCNNAPGCPPEAAACFKDDQSNLINLGKYMSSPVQKEDMIEIKYTDGDSCNHGKEKSQTLITFICSPGNLESSPILIRKSECIYEFEWHTAAACPLGKKYGTDCKVFDDNSGFMFDLNKLTKKEDNYKVESYKVSTAAPSTEDKESGYDYFLNVCGDLQNTPCDDLQLPHPAICQVERGNSGDKWVLGQVNTTLEYFDGVIRMKNFNGTPYKNGKIRKSEISFLCSPSASESQPQFVQEYNGTYFFKWYTPYACPETPIECTITDEKTHQQYDLSSLSKSEDEENWSVIDDNDPRRKKRFYINVCRPINPVAGCAHFAGVCQTEIVDGEETKKIGSVGKPRVGPVIESEGNIMLNYTGGDNCKDQDGNDTPYQTRIHFRCQKGALSSSPQLSEIVDNCEYVFLWETEAACPIEDAVGENCQVKDPNSEYTFNLQVLNSNTGYEVKTGDRTFWMNICGGFERNGDRNCGDDDASFCEVKNGQKINVADVYRNPSFSDDGQLKLAYFSSTTKDTGDSLEVEITFRCRRNETIGAPTFVREEDGYKFLFDFETAVACLPQPVDCFISDIEGNQYDLSPLSTTNSNWEAVDTREGYEHLSYHINVCRPLNPSNDYTCPGGPIGACQTDKKDPSANYDMGYIQANPQAGLDGSLSIHYLGGHTCHGEKFYRSTRINFECSSQEGSPVFQEETARCEYVFAWQTPSACPLSEVKGKNCIVKEPLYGYNFDLSSLHDTTHNYIVKDADRFVYELNVCGALVESECAGDVGVCQKNSDTHINAGKFNQILIHDNGVLKLNYTGGKGSCHETYERSSVITFHCDHSVKGTGSPKFVEEQNSCTYMFDWHTELACPSYKMVQCSYRGDNQYDLTPLAKLDSNYLVVAEVNGETQEIHINLCRSVTHGPGVMCPYDAAACLVTKDKSGKIRGTSLGTVSEGPSWKDDHLVIEYVSGDHCPENKNRQLSSIINFHCSENRVGGLPEFSSYYDCQYSFIWHTDMACQLNNKEKITNDCTALNPLTGFKFDFSSLKNNTGYKVVGATSNHEYLINICGSIVDPDCQDPLKVGTCQVVKYGKDASSPTPHPPRHFNAGNFNEHLHFDDGILFLNYTGGDKCHGDKYTRNTVINFVCNEDSGEVGQPVFVDESDDCTYYFSWHTPLACETHIQCNVLNGTHLYDLSALIAKDGAYMAVPMAADQDPSLYYVNLCRPLNPIEGTICPAGASICKNPENHNSPVSLGHATDGPKIEGDHVTIKYTNGSKCANNKTLLYSSDITFHCLPGISIGTPQMIGYSSDDCTYHFSWSTYVVCPDSKPKEATDECTYHDTTLDYTFDLKPLTHKVYKEIPHTSESDKTFRLSVCGKVNSDGDQCKASAACLKVTSDKSSEISIGSSDSSHQIFSYQDGLLKLQYSEGDTCPHSQDLLRSTTILFECDDSCTPDSPKSECGPKFYYVQGQCMYTFNWKTSLACPPANMPCHIQDGIDIYDLSPLSRITGSWQFTDTNKNNYWLNFCLPVIDRPMGCPEQSAICRKEVNSQVNGATSEAQALGMTRTQSINLQKIGGENILVVQYQHGSTEVCPGGSAAKTTIYFKCGATVGGPLLTSIPLEDDNDCSFTVNWTSTVACNFERKPMIENDNKITVPLSGDVIDLTKLTEKTYTVSKDVRFISEDSVDRYKYLINLGDEGIQQEIDEKCKGSAVCQIKEDSNFYRSIGEPNQKFYYMQSDTLELVISEPGSCSTSKDINTTITFMCGDDLGEPEFLYESNNCQYAFEWHTSVVCLHPHVTNPPPIGLGLKQIEEAIKKHPKTAAAIVAVILGSITICILLIVFHKQDRRAACSRRVKRCFGSSGPDSNYQYSQLLRGEGNTENTNLLFEDENEITEEMADGSAMVNREQEPAMINASSLGDIQDDTLVNIEQNKKNKKKAKKMRKPIEKPRVKAYHDDSDEDILV